MSSLIIFLALGCLFLIGFGLSLNLILQRRLIRRFLSVDALEPRLLEAQQLLNRQGSLKQLAHDLASPLMALELTVPVIDWPVEQVRSATTLAKEWREAVQDWQKISSQAVELCQNYLQADLQINRSSNQTNISDSKLIRLCDLIELVLGSVRPLAERQELRIELEIADELLFFEIDEVASQRILVNLLTNAIQASPSGHAIRITLSHTAQAIEIKVINDGRVITWPEIVEWVERTKAPASGQHGHGLASAFRLCEELTWRLRLNPRASGGLEATLTIPLFTLGNRLI